MIRSALAALLALAACAPAAPEPPAAPTIANLIAPGQFVLIEMTEGPRAAFAGSQGTGRSIQRLDPATGAFGPSRVLVHSPTDLVFDVASGTCALDIDGTAGCTDGSRGTWSIVTP